MKHFEDIWNKAEEVSTSTFTTEDIQIIKQALEIVITEESIGDMLFAIAGLSKKLNINVAKALQDRIDKEMDFWE